MANLSGVVEQLKAARAEAVKEVERLDVAIAALGNLDGSSRRGRTVRLRGVLTPEPARPRRTMSASARRRIAAAQRARWARVRQQGKAETGSGKSTRTPVKRTLSASARKRIAAAQRARWAKQRQAA
jgi:hypothetical protein